MGSVDWNARPDQIEGLALREVTVSAAKYCTFHDSKRSQKFAPILEPFCEGGKTQIALINAVQVYCYEDTKIIKAFPQILKVSSAVHQIDACMLKHHLSNYQVLYNKDCLSDQAIVYWHQKGSKPQGRQHFLKSAEPLVKVIITRNTQQSKLLKNYNQFLQEQESSDEEEQV